MKPDGTAAPPAHSESQSPLQPQDGRVPAAGRRTLRSDITAGAGALAVPGGGDVSARIAESRMEKYADPTSWCYLHLHHANVERFAREVEEAGMHRCFVHRTVTYQKRPHGVKREEKPTVSGLVFLQGGARTLQRYLRDSFPLYHLTNDRATGLPAVIPDSQMQPFMRLSLVEPTRIRILEKPAGQYAKGNVRLRVLTGIFAGQEGYLVRIKKDRRLVVDFGGIAVAIGGVHNEQFEEVKGIVEG